VDAIEEGPEDDHNNTDQPVHENGESETGDADD
jgi:hypothetical protein